MNSPSVVVLQGDSRVAQNLVSLLSKSCAAVHLSSSLHEARNSAIKHRAQAMVLDLELVGLDDLRNLTDELKNVRIVCNHRIADDKLWIAAMESGAADCCVSSDPQAVVNATLRNDDPTKFVAA